MAKVTGTIKNDILNGTSLNDLIYGQAGDDLIHGNAGNDFIDGGDGADTIYGDAGDDSITGGLGNDKIYGGLGADTISGGAGDDLIDGGDGNDILSGGAGADILLGGAGNDQINGGIGNDFIAGGEGNDILRGDAGADILLGGAGSDQITGGIGNDFIDGGDGNDTAIFAGKRASYIIRYNADNTITVIGADGVDALTNVEFLKFNDQVVTARNIAPTTNNVSVTGLEDAGDIAITLSGSDNSSIASFSLNNLPTDGKLYLDAAHTKLITAGSFYTATNNQLTLHFVPNANFNGSVQFNYAAKDNLGLSDATPATAKISVTAVNDAPVVATHGIADQVATEDAAFNFVLSNKIFTDVDNSTLSYSATLSDGSRLPSWLSFDAATQTFSGTPGNKQVGDLSITVTASDGSLSASDTFNLHVNNTNDAPTLVNHIGDLNVTENQSFQYTMPNDAFRDIDLNDQLTYSVTLADGSSLNTIPWLHYDAATKTFSGTTPNLFGDDNLSIKITATDQDGLSASDTFNLNIENVNHAPVLSNEISDQTANEDSLFTYQIPQSTFNDVDFGDHLTYSAALANSLNLPKWLSFDEKTLTFSGTPAQRDVGDVSITVTATDGIASVSDTFNLHVNNTNDAPKYAVNHIQDQVVNEDSLFQYTIPADAFYDLDGDQLTYSVTLADGSSLNTIPWLHYDAATKTFSGTPNDSDVGTLSIKVSASDGQASVSDIFTVQINPVNDAPTAVNDYNVIDEDAEINSVVGNVLSNDSDPDSTFSLLTSGIYNSTHGTLQLNSNGSYVYTLNNDSVNGLTSGQVVYDFFNYTLTDGQSATNSTGQLKIAINGNNDAPVAFDDYAIATENSNAPITGNLLTNDQDPDTTLQVGVGSYQLTYGTLEITDANGSYRYTLNESNASVNALNTGDILGDVFTYSVFDGAHSSSANLIVSIKGTSDPALFTAGDDLVKFDSVYSWQYQAGTQHSAGAGNDHIYLPSNPTEAIEAGYNAQQHFDAGAGNDWINTGSLTDWVGGGDGDDRFFIARNSNFVADQLDGGTGTDYLYLSEIDLAPNETLTISNQIYPTGTAYYSVNAGNQNLVQASNFEYVIGSNNADNFMAGTLTDNFLGLDGNDIFKVVALNSDQSLDSYNGYDGFDRIDLSGLNGIHSGTTINLQTGELYVDNTKTAFLSSFEDATGSSKTDTFISNKSVNTFVGGAGNDTFKVSILNPTGTDVYDGGADDDTLDLSALGTGFTINLDGSYETQALSTAIGTQALLYNIENVTGSNGNDTIITGSEANLIWAGAGDDTILLGTKNISGGGLITTDLFDGGIGNDTVDLSGLLGTGFSASLEQNSLSIGTTPEATLQNIENITGSNQNDTITGNGQNNTLQGLDGNDTLNGGDGDDTLDGGAGNDFLSGGTANDALQGGAGDDTAVYSGGSWQYTWSKAADGTLTIYNSDGWTAIGADGTDTLKNIENIQFSDWTYNTSDLQAYPGFDINFF